MVEVVIDQRKRYDVLEALSLNVLGCTALEEPDGTLGARANSLSGRFFVGGRHLDDLSSKRGEAIVISGKHIRRERVTTSVPGAE